MRIPRTPALIALAILAAMSCARSEPQPDSGERLDAVADEVHAMFEAFFADIEAQGLAAEFDYLDDSPEFYWVPPGYTSALSYDSVRTVLEGAAPGYRSIRYEWDTVRVHPLTNEIASYTGIIRGTFVDTTGAVNEISLIESGNVIKRADGWKYLNGQTAALPVDSTRRPAE